MPQLAQFLLPIKSRGLYVADTVSGDRKRFKHQGQQSNAIATKFNIITPTISTIKQYIAKASLTPLNIKAIIIVGVAIRRYFASFKQLISLLY
jgi:hypothetical protein